MHVPCNLSWPASLSMIVHSGAIPEDCGRTPLRDLQRSQIRVHQHHRGQSRGFVPFPMKSVSSLHHVVFPSLVASASRGCRYHVHCEPRRAHRHAGLSWVPVDHGHVPRLGFIARVLGRNPDFGSVLSCLRDPSVDHVMMLCALSACFHPS